MTHHEVRRQLQCCSFNEMAKSRRPALAGVLFRVIVVTFLVTLLTFALTLLGAILALAIVGELHGGLNHVNMSAAYRHAALPVAITIGVVTLIATSVYEIRRHLQSRTLARLDEKL